MTSLSTIVGGMNMGLRQGLFDYARILRGKSLKYSKKNTHYNDSLTKFDMVWGRNELVYHMSNDRIMCHIKTPNVSLVRHVWMLYLPWGLVVSLYAPKRVPNSLYWVSVALMFIW